MNLTKTQIEKRRYDNQQRNITEDYFKDLIEAGIIDPVKVTRTALQNAASAAAILLTTEVAIVDLGKEEKSEPHPGMGMGY